MKIVIPALMSRNPFVAAARLRRAGSHRPTARTRRRDAAGALRRELDQMKQTIP